MKPLGNPYLKRIASLVNEKDKRLVVQTFVDARRAMGESLDALARRLGVSRIVEQRLPFEGGLFRLPDGELVIKLNSESSFARKRFTLAHEIAHLLLETVPAFRSTRRSDAALERACDMLAAELVMPTAEARSFVCDLGPPSPEKLRTIASRYNVSLHSAAIKVHDDLKLWKCCIGMWDYGPRVRTLWFVGPRRWDEAQPDDYCLDRATKCNASIQVSDLWRRGECREPVSLNLLSAGTSRVLGLVGFVK